MANMSPIAGDYLLPGGEPESKRRKVRKGTQSCWECKRRKVRCTFELPTNSICDTCRRRGTACVSQEYEDDPIPVTKGNKIHVEERLERMEGLIEQLIAQTPRNYPRKEYTQKESPAGHLDSYLTASPKGLSALRKESSADHSDNYPTRAGSPKEHSALNEPKQDMRSEEMESRSHHSLNPSHLSIATVPNRGLQTATTYDQLRHELLAAWPTKAELDRIYTLSVGVSAHLYTGIRSTTDGLADESTLSPQELLKLPPPGCHPLFIARKLLIMGSFLQGAPRAPAANSKDLDINYRGIMCRVVDTARRLVTTNDELTDSVEGIECIMIESMYYNYTGNIRRSWISLRRAVAIAQLMGLHRGPASWSPKMLEPHARGGVDPGHLLFRLVAMDSYLALMLGLPQASLGESFASTKALERCNPMARMQRLFCVAGGRILQRNDADTDSYATTQEIDKLLQSAAAEMPAQWWLIPEPESWVKDRRADLKVLLRVMDQLTYYHLLARLHLPYMLRSSREKKYDYSKITVVNASREVLVRFVSFRISNTDNFYCRGGDFLAFIASTTLCLAHINARCHHRDAGDNEDCGNVYSFLIHQRLSDRGLMERMLGIMQSMADADSSEMIAATIARMLRHLLAIEANAASGVIYSTKMTEMACGGKVTDGGNILRVFIPHIGTIKFECGGAGPASTQPVNPLNDSLIVPSAASRTQLHKQPDKRSNTPATGDYSQADQAASVPPPQQQLADLASNGALSFNNEEETHNTQEFDAPFDMIGGIDEWDLQGVDMAFFDSLSCSADMLDPADGSWTQWMEDGV